VKFILGTYLVLSLAGVGLFIGVGLTQL